MDVLGVITSFAAPPAAVHLTVGGAVASVGINLVMMISFSLLTWWTMGEQDDDLASPDHAPRNAAAFPLPDYLLNAGYERTINIGVFGVSGCGKSSFINALRRRQPGDLDAAPVGVKETTTVPVAYNLIDPDENPEEVPGDGKVAKRPIRVWDLPGAGTTNFPSEECVRDMGLRYFDVVILIVSGRSSELDRKVSEELDMFKVPYFVVRSQVDSDIENELEDYRRQPNETEMILRSEMSKQGFSSVFLVSSRQPDEYDFQQLTCNIVASVQAKRRVHNADACPICFEMFDGEHQPRGCHWCRNSVCNMCAVQLQGKLEETPCPFCRRWTTLSEL